MQPFAPDISASSVAIGFLVNILDGMMSPSGRPCRIQVQSRRTTPRKRNPGANTTIIGSSCQSHFWLESKANSEVWDFPRCSTTIPRAIRAASR